MLNWLFRFLKTIIDSKRWGFNITESNDIRKGEWKWKVKDSFAKKVTKTLSCWSWTKSSKLCQKSNVIKIRWKSLFGWKSVKTDKLVNLVKKIINFSTLKSIARNWKRIKQLKIKQIKTLWISRWIVI
jgi:hypothetical protein